MNAPASRSATPVIREDVVSRLHDRVARESTLGVVPLRWRVGRGSGREPPGRGLILEHGPSPPPLSVNRLLSFPIKSTACSVPGTVASGIVSTFFAFQSS